MDAQNSNLSELEKPVVKIFGVGNAGVSLLDAINAPEFAGASFIAVNTDVNSLASSSAPVKFHLENKLLRGLGSGGDADRGRALAEEQFSALKSACDGATVIFILAGLGGGAGSGIAPVLARAARDAGALVLAFVTLPFECEGNRRETQARHSLEHLKAGADGVICLPSQKIFKLIDENTSLLETFRVTGGFLLEGLRGVWQLLMQPGLIQVHFTDLCALVRDRHAENSFAFVHAAGAGRAREVVDKILTHPLLDEGRALTESDAVLVSLTAGKDLTMAEINRVMSEMKRQCGRAQIIMGAAVDATMKDRLCVTIIAAKQGSAPVGEPMHAEMRGGIPILSERRHAHGMRKNLGNKKAVQTQLPLTIKTKGRFDKSEPTLHQGEDLDVPTFLRRGVGLN